MRILITGSNGQLGTELQKQLNSGYSEIGSIPQKLINAELIVTDEKELNISNIDNVYKIFQKYSPDLVLNCAAYTNVDDCEKNPELAYQVNAIGPKNLALACLKYKTILVHISTDYVFSGRDNTGISQDELTQPNPISMYGKTKLAGEVYVKENCKHSFIIRTAWLYSYYGKNFVKTIINAGEKYGKITVVNDQFGNPTNAVDLAYEILQLCITDQYGLYHCTGNGICSWFDFAKEIIYLSNTKAVVTPCSTAEYCSIHKDAARRPAWSALDNKHLRETVGDSMRPWKIALKEYFKRYDKNDGFQKE